MKHTLSVLVEDEAGVLTRIAGLFARRGSILKVWLLAPQSNWASLELRWLSLETTVALNNLPSSFIS